MKAVVKRIRPFVEDYLVLGIEEFRRAQIVEHQSILLVGCSALPMTAVVYCLLGAFAHRNRLAELVALVDDTQSPLTIERSVDYLEQHLTSENPQQAPTVTCIDQDERAVTMARRVIMQLGLSRYINIELSKAEQFDRYHHFSLIHLASMVRNRCAVLEKLFSAIKTSGHASTIIVRHTEKASLRSLLYEPLDTQTLSQLIERFPGTAIQSTYTPAARSSVVTGFHVLQYIADKHSAAIEHSNLQWAANNEKLA